METCCLDLLESLLGGGRAILKLRAWGPDIPASPGPKSIRDAALLSERRNVRSVRGGSVSVVEAGLAEPVQGTPQVLQLLLLTWAPWRG